MSGDIGHMLALVHNIDRNLGALVSLVLDIRKVSGYVQCENAVVASKQPEYLTVRDGAKVTGLSYSMIRRTIVKQELPASKIASIWRIRRGELIAWMEKAKGGSSIPPRSELTELVGHYFGRR